MSIITRTRLLIVAALALAAVAAAPAGSTSSTWANHDTATIHPGVQTVTEGGQCTANFVFTNPDGSRVFIGQAAHCSGTDGNTATNGCEAGTRPLGTQVEVDGASQPGTIVYSSWVEMQENGETDTDTCRYNDFALVELDPADHDKVNPTVPFWGGPTTLGTSTTFGEQVYSYGNSGLRFGISELSPKTGTSLGQTGNGWTHPVYTVSPGIPGDSGSAFLNSTGEAVGVLSTLQIAPIAGSNGVSDLALALAYMEANTDLDAELVLGTEPFDPDPLD